MRGRHCPHADSGDSAPKNTGLILHIEPTSFDELQRRASRTWVCSCGHTETHGNPETLRALAKAHAGTHEGVK